MSKPDIAARLLSGFGLVASGVFLGLYYDGINEILKITLPEVLSVGVALTIEFAALVLGIWLLAPVLVVKPLQLYEKLRAER